MISKHLHSLSYKPANRFLTNRSAAGDSTALIQHQWSRNVFWIGGAKVNLKVTNLRNCYDSVRSTLSMRSMLLLGGSGGMPPQESFEK